MYHSRRKMLLWLIYDLYPESDHQYMDLTGNMKVCRSSLDRRIDRRGKDSASVQAWSRAAVQHQALPLCRLGKLDRRWWYLQCCRRRFQPQSRSAISPRSDYRSWVEICKNKKTECNHMRGDRQRLIKLILTQALHATFAYYLSSWIDYTWENLTVYIEAIGIILTWLKRTQIRRFMPRTSWQCSSRDCKIFSFYYGLGDYDIEPDFLTVRKWWFVKKK